MADSWSRQVSLVVMLIDDLTDKVITDAARVRIEGFPAPVRKSEGYYVFTNLTGDGASVRIEHGMYEPKILQTDLPKEGEGYFLRKVRLTPGRCCRLPSGTTCVEGQAEPFAKIFMFSREGGGGMKLLYAYEGNGSRSISIYHPADIQLEGKLLHIEGKEDPQGEGFRILERKDEGNYILEKPLSRGYKQIGTNIYPMYEAEADEKGRFFLPILRVGSQRAVFCCRAVGKKQVYREIALEKSSVNRVTLLEEE